MTTTYFLLRRTAILPELLSPWQHPWSCPSLDSCQRRGQGQCRMPHPPSDWSIHRNRHIQSSPSSQWIRSLMLFINLSVCPVILSYHFLENKHTRTHTHTHHFDVHGISICFAEHRHCPYPQVTGRAHDPTRNLPAVGHQNLVKQASISSYQVHSYIQLLLTTQPRYSIPHTFNVLFIQLYFEQRRVRMHRICYCTLETKVSVISQNSHLWRERIFLMESDCKEI